MGDEPIVIDTPEGIAHYAMAATIAALKIEVDTGMRASRQSATSVAKVRYGCPKRTKEGALEWMLALYWETYGREYGSK